MYTQPYAPTAAGIVIAAANIAARGAGNAATAVQEIVFDTNGLPNVHLPANESNVTGLIFLASNSTRPQQIVGLFYRRTIVFSIGGLCSK